MGFFGYCLADNRYQYQVQRCRVQWYILYCFGVEKDEVEEPGAVYERRRESVEFVLYTYKIIMDGDGSQWVSIWTNFRVFISFIRVIKFFHRGTYFLLFLSFFFQLLFSALSWRGCIIAMVGGKIEYRIFRSIVGLVWGPLYALMLGYERTV